MDEIRRQPETLARALAAERRSAEQFKRLVEKQRPRLIVLAARGTSDNAALFGRYLLEIATGIPVSLAAPSVTTIYRARMDYRETLVVGLSQSGESTDVNCVIEQAKSQGSPTLGITNESKSALAGLADHVFLVRAGKERSVAATKTYTGEMLMLYLLAYSLGGAIPLTELERIPETVESALRLEAEVASLSERFRYMRYAVAVGRGLNFANAYELSLKLMETCYVVAERFSSADFLHGPIALVEPGFPVFAFAPRDRTWPSMRSAIEKLHRMRAEIVTITDAANPAASARATRTIRIPAELKPLFTPIPYIVPAQILAASLAERKGLDPDRPRMLSKVTLTL